MLQETRKGKKMSESFIYYLILNQFSKWDTFYIFLWNSSELQARLRESQIHLKANAFK